MTDPVDIAVARQSSTVDSVRQLYAVVPFRDKVDALTRFLQVTEGDAAIVFVRTKEACDQVGADLVARGVSAAVMNGDVPQKEREKIIERLRDGRLDVLVATDVAPAWTSTGSTWWSTSAPGGPGTCVRRRSAGPAGQAHRHRADLLHITPRRGGPVARHQAGPAGLLEPSTRCTWTRVTRHKAAAGAAQARLDVSRLGRPNRMVPGPARRRPGSGGGPCVAGAGLR